MNCLSHQDDIGYGLMCNVLKVRYTSGGGD